MSAKTFTPPQTASRSKWVGAITATKTSTKTAINKDTKKDTKKDVKTFTPLHTAAQTGAIETARKLLCGKLELSVNCKDKEGKAPLHYACAGRHLKMIEVLIKELNADVNCADDRGKTPLHYACESKRSADSVIRMLALDFHANVNCADSTGKTPLHYACDRREYLKKEHRLTNIEREHVVKLLISELKADVNSTDRSGKTPLYYACKGDFKCLIELLLSGDVNSIDSNGMTALHHACTADNFDVIKKLTKEMQADPNSTDSLGRTPLHYACMHCQTPVVEMLILDIKVDAACVDSAGWTALHYACSVGNLSCAKLIASKVNLASTFSINDRDKSGMSVLHYACSRQHADVVSFLVTEMRADINVTDTTEDGKSPLHYACAVGHIDIIRTIMRPQSWSTSQAVQTEGESATPPSGFQVFLDALTLTNCFQSGYALSADVNLPDKNRKTPLYYACAGRHKDIVEMLINDYKADVNCIDVEGKSLFHYACLKAWPTAIVEILLPDFKDFNRLDSSGNSLLHYAFSNRNNEILKLLLPHLKRDAQGRTPLHLACALGHVEIVIHSVLQPSFKPMICGDANDCTPLMVAAKGRHDNIAQALIHRYKCPVGVNDKFGNTTLHYACRGGSLSLVKMLMTEHELDITARNAEDDTPLHEAALMGHIDVITFVLKEPKCRIDVNNFKGKSGGSLLHSACAGGSIKVVKYLCSEFYKTKLFMTVNNNGDTPLHICSALGYVDCVKALLNSDAPLLIRNNSRKTPEDVATAEVKVQLRQFIERRKGSVYNYDEVMICAKKKYPSPERVSRMFVLGSSGAGKSSLIKALKRSIKVLKSEEPPRTVSDTSLFSNVAGIVPSEHPSMSFGRILFYDFAGDVEHYSSHIPVLKDLTSSSVGDNIFIIVVDLSDDKVKVENTLNAWISFIQRQQFGDKTPSLILVGSHAASISQEELAEQEAILRDTSEKIQPHFLHPVPHFILDCRTPQAKGELQRQVTNWVKDSPAVDLSHVARILLGLLAKDFAHVASCSIETLVSHIEDSGINLPKDVASLHPIVLELHESGFLFMVKSSACTIHLGLDIPQVISKIHQLLHSTEAKMKQFNIGVIPQNVLLEMSPECITNECLFLLQYCQEINSRDVNFESADDISLFFFPALLNAGRCQVEWVTPLEDSYSIGWLAMAQSDHSFPSHFLHILLLRVVFTFTLPAPSASSGSSDYSHFQRRCTMWNTGVHWLMEEGVECVVEMVPDSAHCHNIVVRTKSNREDTDECITVFNNLIGCVMEVKAKFCHSTPLEYFLLNSTEANYLSPDNRFAMSDVERSLNSSQPKPFILSSNINGKGRMEYKKVTCLRKLTHWHTLFPLDFKSVIAHLEPVGISSICQLGRHLKVSESALDSIDRAGALDSEKSKRELVREWMSRSKEPPSWWHLVDALNAAEKGELASKIETQYSTHFQLQEKLFDYSNHDVKPDPEFMEAFAGVVGSRWPSLAVCLSLREKDIEEVRAERLSHCEHAHKMMLKWKLREDATYGQLYQMLRKPSLFQYMQ